ncbi:hypothetical protein [Plantactinospora sp. GCM10030261]|uniref:hypothetical protein n=1 Tax=Plantactinospora sp. GCM10030261 TaxID=3273420 RepID=UPI003608F6F2
MLLALLLGLVFPAALRTGEGGTPAALAFCVMALAGARLGRLVATGEPRLMEFSFWTFVYVFLGLPALIQFQTATFPAVAPWFDHNLSDDAMWATLIGSSAAFVGVWLATGLPVADRSMSARPINEGRAYLLAVGALMANLYYLARVGPASLLLSRQELVEVKAAIWPDIETGMAALMLAACTLPLLVAFIGLLRVNRQRTARGEPRRYLLLILVGCAVVYSINPISSPRYHTGTVLLSMAAAMGAYATAWRARISALAFIFGLIFLFPVADAFRRPGGANWQFDPWFALTTGDFNSATQTINSLTFINDNGIAWGQQLLGVPLFWVPRHVWPEKPDATGVVIAEYMGYPYTNDSSPLISELLINGGWPLMIIGMLVVGWWVRRRDDYFIQRHRLGERPAEFGWILPFYLIILLRGSLLSAALHFAVMWVAARFVIGRSGAAGMAPPRQRRSHASATDVATSSGGRRP